MPDRNVQPRHACLVHGRNVGRCRQAALVRHGIGLDRAGTHLRYGIGSLVDHDVDLAGHKVLHPRARLIAATSFSSRPHMPIQSAREIMFVTLRLNSDLQIHAQVRFAAKMS
jgi:hypothetical protein